MTHCARPGHTVRLPPMENPRTKGAYPSPAPLYTPYLTHTYMGKYFTSTYKQSYHGNPVVGYPRSFLPDVTPKPFYQGRFVKQG